MAAAFTVTEILNGSNIKVSPNWVWEGLSGNLVKINWSAYPNNHTEPLIISKLKTLILNKNIELKNPIDISHTAENMNTHIIRCSIFLNEINISQYFPELKTHA